MKIIKERRSLVRTCTALLLGGAAFLQGCSDTIDAREMREIRGLIYKFNKDDPYTGKITNYRMTAAGILGVGTCDLDVKKGELDGTMLCKSNDGKKVLEAEYDQGKKSGQEEVWDAASGEIMRRTQWEAGRKHGLEESYNPAIKALVQRVEWQGGQRQGRDQAWDLGGKTLLRDMTWTAGVETGFEKSGNHEVNFKNGKRHGIQRTYQHDRSSISAAAVYELESRASRFGALVFYPLLGKAELRKEVEFDNGNLVRTIVDRDADDRAREEALSPCISEWRTAHREKGETITIGADLQQWRQACIEGKRP